MDESEKEAFKAELRKQYEEMVIRGIDKWMDKRFATFGRWTLWWLLAGFFGFLIVSRVKLMGVLP
jgi:hypothetical protein